MAKPISFGKVTPLAAGPPVTLSKPCGWKGWMKTARFRRSASAKTWWNAPLCKKSPFDVGADLHAAQPELLDLGHGGGGQLGILHGQDPECVEVLTDLGGQPPVHFAAIGVGRLGVGPVTEQFGHGREHLACHAVLLHVLATALGIPGRPLHRTEGSPAHVGHGAVAGALQPRPLVAAGTGEGQVEWDHMRMDVDHDGAAVSGAPTTSKQAKTLLVLKMAVSTKVLHVSDALALSMAPASTNQLSSSC